MKSEVRAFMAVKPSPTHSGKLTPLWICFASGTNTHAILHRRRLRLLSLEMGRCISAPRIPIGSRPIVVSVLWTFSLVSTSFIIPFAQMLVRIRQLRMLFSLFLVGVPEASSHHDCVLNGGRLVESSSKARLSASPSQALVSCCNFK